MPTPLVVGLVAGIISGVWEWWDEGEWSHALAAGITAFVIFSLISWGVLASGSDYGCMPPVAPWDPPC